MLREQPPRVRVPDGLPPETSDTTSPRDRVVDGDGEVFVERLRAIAQQFLAILPNDTQTAPGSSHDRHPSAGRDIALTTRGDWAYGLSAPLRAAK